MRISFDPGAGPHQLRSHQRRDPGAGDRMLFGGHFSPRHLYPTNLATKRGLKKLFYTVNGHLEGRLQLQAYLSKKDGDTSVGSALEGLLRDLMEVAETWKETSETHRLIDSHGLMVIFMMRLSKIMMLLETEFHEILWESGPDVPIPRLACSVTCISWLSVECGVCKEVTLMVLSLRDCLHTLTHCMYRIVYVHTVHTHTHTYIHIYI